MRKFAATKKRSRESGYGLVFAAIGLLVFLGAAGLSVDMGYLRYQRRLLQTAADSAALAGAAQLGAGAGVGQAVIAARADSQLNGFENGGDIVVTPTHITLNGNANTMQVTVQSTYPTFFMRIFGASFRNAIVSTTATAQYVGSRGCIYALTGGSGLNVGGTLNVPNCNVFSNEGISGGGSIRAAAVGSHSGSSITATPPVIPGMVRTSDPLANIAAPGIPGGACTTISYTANKPGGQTPLFPGKYCSISFGTALSQNVTLNAGTYVITGPGTALSFKGSGTISGTGVTFYITNGSVQTNASQHLNFTATNSGILFFQKNTNGSTATIAATGGSKLQGALYFPNATLNLNGGANGAASGSQYMLLVAQTLNLNTNVNFLSNYNSLPNATSPIRTSVLVE